MEYKKTLIKDGITLHKIKTDKYKTNVLAIFLSTNINRDNVTKNALIPSILRRGTKKLNTQEQISKKLEEMYGAGFNCGIDRIGENHVLKFYIEVVNDNFLPDSKENVLKESIECLTDIVFDPYLENETFKEEYLEQEKNTIKQKIESKIDNKSQYALDRCIEEMYKGQNIGLYKFGYTEDLEKISSNELYKYYEELIATCKIDIFVSGTIDDKLDEIIANNENIIKLQARNANYKIMNLLSKEKYQEKNVVDKMDVVQGKLIIGLDLDLKKEEQKYSAIMYNGILGGSATSKLFQNVREKAQLAYIASSSYVRNLSNIFIKCGIEICNYNKALKLIKEQMEDIKNGDFSIDDIENTKKVIISGLKTVDEDQIAQISYYIGQELSSNPTNIQDYIDNLNRVQKEDILKIAELVNINTIYFLKNEESN